MKKCHVTFQAHTVLEKDAVRQNKMADVLLRRRERYFPDIFTGMQVQL